MKHFLYTRKIGNDESHKKLGRILQDLPEGEYVITIKKNRAVRSISANGYYHVILNLIATHTGQGSGDQQFDHKQLHEIFKKKFNSEIKYLPKGGAEILGKTTADLDTKEFAEYINRVKHFAREEWGIIIPESGDLDHLKRMEIENNYTRTFSGY